MSNSNSTVGFEFTSCTPEDQGSLWFAFGASVPTNYQHALFYTFNFQNNTTGASFDYDVSSLLEGENVQYSGINGSESGTVSPGETATVMIYRASDSEKDSDNNELSIQIGAAPLITNLNGSTVCFWFSDDGGTNSSYQQIAICQPGNGTTFPISSTPTQTSTQQICESSSDQLGIGLGGGGGQLNTQSIWIQVWDLDQTP
ncbi:MAG: hypothetical protein ACK41W_01545 [Cyanobacteriota bacterium]|jgi:hypothetical protein